MYVILNDELYHHGIKGQKWGVRRFQNADGTRTAAGKERYYKNGSGSKSAENNKTHNLKTILNSKLNNNFKGSEEWKLNDLLSDEEKQEQMIETAKIVVTKILPAVAAVASATVLMSREKKKNKEDNPFSDIKKTKPAKNKEDDMKKINPDYNKTDSAMMNCALCTTAYDMRRRGYDVTANFSRRGRSLKSISNYYENTTKKDWVRCRGEKKIMKAFDSMPDGSRGNICARVGQYNSGHSMVWEKENGKVVIRDCQTNAVYKGRDLFYKDGSKGIIRANMPVQILRTDNREINKNEIMDAIRPVDYND